MKSTENKALDPFSLSQDVLSITLNEVDIKIRTCNILGNERIYISSSPCDDAGNYYSLNIECVASNSIILGVSKTEPF
ncbi:hypothetical protein JD508_15350 [Aeromonas jandaei]|uniref:hypothetical protein n=1 Tax=Aeromonas jandaei TaxID=650 RepID=UPI00191ED277|nr:hypothetical protein [Aeromonas jandaei]MBL0611615.1 hypothetical protein [Aeromonas jandaei]